MSRHASGSSTPAPAPVTDIYRPTTSATQRTISHLLPPGTSPTTRPSIPDILDVDDKTFTARVSNKNILIDKGSPSAAGVGGDVKAVSELVVGKKRHRGYPQELLKARREAEHQQDQREAVRAEGLRRVRRRTREGGGVLGKGAVHGITYKSLIPLHHLHLAYLTALLALPPLPPPNSSSGAASSSNTSSLPEGLSAEGIQSKILKSDLTGSILLIIASRNPSLIGIKGIVIEETASTVRLISRDDIIRIIPKNGTQFQLSFPAYAPPPMTEDQRRDVERGEPEPAVDWEEHARSCPRVQLDILGTSFGYRSADRAGRKFRPAQGGGGGSGWGEEWVRGEWSGVLEGVEQEMEARKCPTTKLAQGKVSERASRKGNGRKAGSGQGASESGHDANGDKKRKRGKSRRKDLPQWGRLDVP